MFPDEDDTPNWSAPNSKTGEELAGYQQEQAGSEEAALEAELSENTSVTKNGMTPG